MKSRDHDLVTVDPEDIQASREWAARRAEASRQLVAAIAELNAAEATLTQPATVALLQTRDRRRTDTATAQARLDTAQAARQTADDARAQQELAAGDAGEALDQATSAISTALAALLREAQTTLALTSTVDGLALRARYAAALAADPPAWDHTTIPFLAADGDQPADPELNFPAVGSTDYQRLRTVLDQLDVEVDAIVDLVTAESVHQLVQGNLVRSGAALEVARSGGVPDGFDVVRTPQTGETVNHRVLMVCEISPPAAWPYATSVGALADPILAAWTTALLPAPGGVSIAVRRLRDDGESTDRVDLTLADLDLDPLGLIRTCADPADLRQRVAHVARSRWTATLGEAAALSGSVVIEPNEAGSHTLDDFVAAAGALRELIGQSRSLAPDDFTRPGSPSVPVAEESVAEVEQRVLAVEGYVEDVASELAASAGPGQPSAVAGRLLAASLLGVAGATPLLDLPQTPGTLATLGAQATRAAQELRTRLTGAPWQPDPANPGASLREARTRIAALLGWQLPVLIALPTPAGRAWTDGLAGQTLNRAEPAAVREWLSRYAQVRRPVAAAMTAFGLAEALGLAAQLAPVATQLLATDGEPEWFGDSPTPPAGLTNVVVCHQLSSSAPPSVTGLFVDGWTQRTPGLKHHTGLAFHYDEPDSTPPQAVLVAVPPDLTPGRQPDAWDLGTLTDLLWSTLQLAGQRAAPAETLSPSGITIGALP